MTTDKSRELIFIESPRDAWQGISQFIPTHEKAEFINSLLNIGFDIVETGSFVSPKAIPQLSDTAEVIELLKPSGKKTKIMVLVGNLKGTEAAVQFEKIDLLSYPFSASPQFLERNLRMSEEESLKTIGHIQNLCLKNKKKLIVYITMAFGNPYEDPWNIEILSKLIKKIAEFGINHISFTDILGIATQSSIEEVFQMVKSEYPGVVSGLHLHAHNDWKVKISAARTHGCTMFDSVLGGRGGCPMTGKDLLGNVDTANLLKHFSETGENTKKIDPGALSDAVKIANRLYNH
jgi:hydroxymethylglutaryl-CoA lyase